MNFYYKPAIPEPCPACRGRGKAPDNFYPCSRCEGSGYIIRLTLTYPKSTDTAGNPTGMFYAGEIERPYRREDC